MGRNRAESANVTSKPSKEHAMRHAFLLTPDGTSLRKLALTVAVCATIAGCGGKEPASNSLDTDNSAGTAAQSADGADPSEQQAAVPAEPVPTLPPSDALWTPEEKENLLAPVALYPDVVLAQVLIASTNPQEVLDAGNWLLENSSLEGEQLDEAAAQVGFTLPIRALIQFPQVIDMMCQDLDWTSELGQAYINDQAGVLDAAQRLRVQAKDVGNLQSSDEMEVETITQDNEEIVTISPPDTDVVYVPQYDPVAAYAPAPTATTTTTVVEEEGYSSGDMLATGLLAFGAGMLVNEILNDDDDYYYGGGYWGRPPAYYPSYAYRPRYGNGFHPSHGYNRGNGNFNNNTVIVNKDNNYWKNRERGNDRSPISEARGNRPELGELNDRAARGPERSAPRREEGFGDRRPDNKLGDGDRQAGNSQRSLPKIQGSYAGAKPGSPGDRSRVGNVDTQRERPKIQGSYAGAKPTAQRQTSGLADRGRPSHDSSRSLGSAGAKSQHKPLANRSSGPSRTSALSGSRRGSHDRAASKRGRQSMKNHSSSRSHSRPQRGNRR